VRRSGSAAAAAIGLCPFFGGVIVVAVVGNAAEHWVSVYFASRDKMDISVNIAVGSGAQIALFVAPVLVLASFVIGTFPMALVFNGFDRRGVFGGHHRQRGNPTRRVHLVRRPATTRHLRCPRTHLLLRLTRMDHPVAAERIGGSSWVAAGLRIRRVG
jgi:hypothetical protein